MATVSQSMATRGDLDVSYITSRVLAMSFPAEGLESAYRNHVEDVRGFLEARHPAHHVIYNLSGRHYPPTKFSGRVIEASWSAKRAPPLVSLFHLAMSVYDFLQKDPKNVAVIHCMDGRASTATLVCALLLLCRAFRRPEQALNMFAIKRLPPLIQPSQFRYLGYVSGLLDPSSSPASSPASSPHDNLVSVSSITLSPVPTFTQRRDGVRPYVEV